MSEYIILLKKAIKRVPGTVWLAGRLVSLYNHITKPWGFCKSFIIFPIQGFCRVHKLFGLHKPYDKIEEVKNIHDGERCFIVSTGPSLTVDDVNLLKNEYTISVNTIFKMYDKTDWRPTYYTIMHYGGYKLFHDRFKFDVDSLAVKNVFLESHARKEILDARKVIFVNLCWLDHWYNHDSLKFKYNPNLLYGMYDYFSITHAAIILAIYMGFKKIYLIGADNNYFGKLKHFKGEDEVNYISRDNAVYSQITMTRGYKVVKKIAQKKGVEIVNVTRGGSLECFPRQSLESVLQESEGNKKC